MKKKTHVANAPRQHVGDIANAARLIPLTAHELEIAQLRVGGMKPKEIAARLGVSVKTISMSLYRISRKLGVKTRGQLVRAVDAMGVCGGG